MRRVLAVDCCIRQEESRTKRLFETFLSALPGDCEIERLELVKELPAYLEGDYLRERDELIARGEFSHPRFDYANRFAAADLVVIGAPFWDLAFPALLKVYIEQISVDGITFHAGEQGLEGLCRGTDLVFLTTRGGIYGPGSGSEAMEMGSRYLEALHHFFGIDRYHLIAAEGLDIFGADTEGIVAEAEERARALAGEL